MLLMIKAQLESTLSVSLQHSLIWKLKWWRKSQPDLFKKIHHHRRYDHSQWPCQLNATSRSILNDSWFCIFTVSLKNKQQNSTWTNTLSFLSKNSLITFQKYKATRESFTERLATFLEQGRAIDSIIIIFQVTYLKIRHPNSNFDFDFFCWWFRK
jgi:hypothetical protein